MLQAQSAVYTGKDFEDGYNGYFATEHVFMVLSVEEGMTKEEGAELLQEIKKHITHIRSFTLGNFESKISDLVLQLNLPAGSSLAAGLIHEDVLYVKTMGKGQIYMRRGKEFIKLISGNNSASGYLKQFDCVIFTTALFNGLLGDSEDIKSFIDVLPPQDIVDELQSQEYDEENRGVISLFVEFIKQEETIIEAEKPPIPESIHMDAIYKSDAELESLEGAMEESELDKHIRSDYHPPQKNVFTAKIEGFKEQISNFKTPHLPVHKSKKLTLAIVGVIFVILVWSVVFGYQRRAEAKRTEKVETTKALVEKKMLEAEEVAFLNLDRAMGLITEAKAEVDTLKKDVGTEKQKEIAAIDQLIKDTENQIVKKEEKSYEEFYDLALENKDATGSNMYVDGENVTILDNAKGRVYTLSLTKKSLEKRTAAEVSGAAFVAASKDRTYFLGNEGIYQFTGADKVKRVVEEDPDWGEIVGIFIYNGNVYVLDQDNNEIYKYTATDAGLSKKSSYFQSGQSVNLSSATSLAIDSSIFISNGAQILKYTRGVQEEFKTTFPTSDASITKLYTNEEMEKIYAWDKAKGTIYVVNKSGNYERQLKADVLQKATDFFVYNDSIYILSGQKIYKMGV